MNIIFRQTRIGINYSHFTIYKLRTMQDGKVTRIGYWLRLLKLDELPQLYNILKGEMSLVGPRPLIPHEDHGYRGFPLTCKPGMTGWWQIHGCKLDEIAHYDKEYMALKSILFDMLIVMLTIPMTVWRWKWLRK